MKIMCSWCGIEKGTIKNEFDNNIVSHGICKDCSNFLLENEPTSISHFLSRINMPVFLVNDEGKIITSNNTGLNVLEKQLSEIENRLGGQVMDCIHSRQPEGCGNTVHCAGCTIRNTVMKSFKLKRSIRNVKGVQTIYKKGEKVDLFFRISTNFSGKHVLLKFLQLEPINEKTKKLLNSA